ncbi:hypothetical protein BY996DRAFT_6411460 [Phakopsora pachyrhizi]|nr:hypothetical protein BY996DRAFT_6411460 [Phakopsora pachyrhizi]
MQSHQFVNVTVHNQLKKPKDSGTPPATTSTAGTASKPLSQTSTKATGNGSLKVSSPGMLVIRIVEANGLKLPNGAELPERIQRVLASDASNHGSVSSSVGPGSQNRANHWASVHRKQKWWLPYKQLEHKLAKISDSLQNNGFTSEE